MCVGTGGFGSTSRSGRRGSTGTVLPFCRSDGHGRGRVFRITRPHKSFSRAAEPTVTPGPERVTLGVDDLSEWSPHPYRPSTYIPDSHLRPVGVPKTLDTRPSSPSSSRSDVFRGCCRVYCRRDKSTSSNLRTTSGRRCSPLTGVRPSPRRRPSWTTKILYECTSCLSDAFVGYDGRGDPGRD